jgi:hypothetical protein
MTRPPRLAAAWMLFSNCSGSSVRWFVEHSNPPPGAISGIANAASSS